ncbi:unnamed protein product [Durusdinium trenchii]|uniref:Poly [ADP-ribose] polymerase n=1 Tax=Durusdinium trenchii TaxID=1381693 RepID=A0ABP0JSX5_9DINO
MLQLLWVFILVGSTSGADWSVTDGNCQVDDEGCLHSPRYPSNYRNNQNCEIDVAEGNAKSIVVAAFKTEAGYDLLEVNGEEYSGTSGPDNVIPTGTIRWSTDYSVIASGWKLCLQDICVEKMTGNGEDYRGCQASTRSGTACQRWDSNSPHLVGLYTSSNYPSSDLTENYCRNPGGSGDTIWCFTSDPDVRWDYCDHLRLWTVQGSCEADLTCSRSPSYPSQYGNNEECTLQLGTRAQGGVLQVKHFETESNYDILIVDGPDGVFSFSGQTGPQALEVGTGLEMSWVSDHSITKSGWEICVIYPELSSTTTMTETSSSKTTISTSITTRTITSSTTVAPERSMHGQLLLTVADAAAAQDAFETSAGAEALRQGLAAPFPELNADNVMLLGTALASARRLASSGVVVVDYLLTVASGAALDHSLLSSSSAALTQSINQALSDRSIAVTVSNVQNVQLTTVTTSTVTSTMTSTTSQTATFTTATLSTTNTPVNCQLSDWSEWGKCNRPCNGGNQTRTRTVAVAEQFGGTACAGDIYDEVSCNTDECSECIPGYHLVFISSQEAACLPCERGRYNPVASADSSGACKLCPRGEESLEGATMCSPCSLGSGGTVQLSSVASASSAELQNFQRVDGVVELVAGSAGSLTFQAACASPRSFTMTVEVWLPSAESLVLELQVGGGAPVAWSFGTTASTWQTTDASPQLSFQEGESLIRLWASASGLRIRSLSMQFQNMGDECGFFPDEEVWTCARCDPGYYAGTVGLRACETCEPGGYSSLPGSSRCETCKPGSYSNRSGATAFDVCEECPMGFFSNRSGMSACEPCVAGSFYNQSGASSGDLCEPCPPGSSSEPGSISCTECEIGRFAGIAGELCSPCPAGTVTVFPGATNCTECPPGTYSENGTVCTACPAGSFSILVAAGSLESCEACPAGTYSETEGADSPTYCLGCAAGAFSAPGSKFCEMCPPGEISSDSAPSCSPCELGSFAGVPGMSECEPCPAGTHGHSNTSYCMDCLPGSYSEVRGAAGPETCTPCAAGSASASYGAASQLSCEPCRPGFAAAAGSALCSVCEAGTYSTLDACKPCSVGEYMQYFGQTECRQCDPGTFNDQDQLPTIACQACPIGTFTSLSGATAMSDCEPCPAGTRGISEGLDQCEACPAGFVSRLEGSSICNACPMSNTPPGAVACCPETVGIWGSSGSLSLAPGKSKAEVYYVDTAGSCDTLSVESAVLAQDGQIVSSGHAMLITMGQEEVFSCVELTCNEVDKAHCGLRIVLNGRQLFGTGEALEVQALVQTQAGSEVCENAAQVVFEGFGCAPNTLQIFLLALSIVVSATVLLGLIFELVGHCRVLILVECSFSIKLPTMWATHTSSAVVDFADDSSAPAAPAALAVPAASAAPTFDVCPERSPSRPRRLSDKESEVVVADEKRLVDLVKGPSFVEDPEEDVVKIGWDDDVVGDGGAVGARSSVDHHDVLLERSELKFVRSASHGAQDGDEDALSQSSLAWPSQAALKQSLLQQLDLDPRRLVHFTAWAVKSEAPMLQVEYSVRVPKGQHLELRQQLSRCKWQMAPTLPAPWNQAHARAPGMDLLDFVEKFLGRLSGSTKQEEDPQQLQQLHLQVARQLLRRLTSRKARLVLGLQYFCNLCAAALLPIAGYQMMTSCDHGFPWYIHGAWFLYMCLTNVTSLTLLRTISGEHAASFCYQFRWRLLFRAVCSFILLTDTYQDATFPVIANRCNFELWFVSAWLVGLGVGLMQVVMQLLVIASCWRQYEKATTPEERDRLLVQGAFIALRGSDNLVLVYAVRPAVEERLGGSSSWAMKLSEARIALLRFVFEDVEQSALQTVFLIFYDEAAIGDKLWVTASIFTSLLLSFTIVVQCIPEVRDWLWYRVFAAFPGGRGIPLLRVLWFIIILLLYRCLSTFPWISACSPSGDPCETEREWWEFYWGCANGRTTLLGLEARVKVVQETITNSTIGVVIILSTVTFATIVWWTRQRCLQIYRYRKMDSLESYSYAKRIQPYQDAPLRPLIDADDDLWLDTARQLHMLLTKHVKAPRPAAEVRKLHRLLVSLESIDRNAYTVSRAHLGGWSLPGVHWYIARQLPKKVNAFVDMANAVQLSNDAMTNVYLLRTTVNHAVRVARVRRHVHQLLSNRYFIKASLESKALWILECPDAPPLRLLHWSELTKGALPKYQSGDAKSVENLLDDMAHRSAISREMAQQRLVVFLLSHRWLRTSGAQYHPDSEDNIKAQKLVTFARWFMRLAAAAGVPCEVAFWIDYCCCEQEDRFGMDLATAALPLYIACCSKVVVWRTVDFDRRCWTMVERLLSYSFCSGGLTPYVIDSTFIDGDEDEEDAVPREVEVCSVWEVRLDGGWVAFDNYGQAMLHSAKAAGLPRSEVSSGGRRYDIDLVLMCQKNPATGKQRQIRERILGSVESSAGVADAERGLKVSENQKQLRSSQKTSQDNGLNMQDRIQRVPKKLPNPLDPETCLLTRESQRRHVASLVSVAMQVPAFEVFADRQPVEWGLSEVIEHSLIDQEPLPREGVASEWLELCHGSFGPNAPTTCWWKLLVLEPGNRSHPLDPLADVDVIVWVDHGATPAEPVPRPEEIDQLFAQVDVTIDHGTSAEREECIKKLILALKADLMTAIHSNDHAQMEAAVLRAREVELPAKTEAVSCLVTSRLLTAAESGSEAEMRNALRFAREKGMEKLSVYQEVLALQQGLYGAQLKLRLQRLAAEESDFAQLGAVHRTAQAHGLEDVARQALAAAEMRLRQALELDMEEALQKCLQLRDEAKACGWSAMEQSVEVQVLRLTMELALLRSELTDDLATIRAVELRARQENLDELAERAARKVNETARKVGEKMGLPAGWDVVERMAGTDAARLLKKDEETELALLKKVQELVDATFWGWGGHGAKTRTRDRGSEPVAKALKVMSVIYVQNAEVYVNYRARRQEISGSMTPDIPTGDAWDVKTAAIPLVGGRLKDSPVDASINEFYLWHGCKPEGAEGITDANFDIKRAGSAYGSLFGPGIYLAESCMKADEYTSPDARGYFPLLLCRVALGNINYCDHPSPVSIGPSLVASCKAGGGFHSVLGDREKVNGTFREFIVFDNHQVYPEYIIWYRREF